MSDPASTERSAAAGEPEGRREIPRLHLLTNDGILAEPRFLALARALLARGGALLALHLRGPGTAARHLWELGTALDRAAAASGALLTVNDRVDVALALLGRPSARRHPPAVHLGGRSLPVADVRALIGPTPIVGRSIHRRGETTERGLDYLMVGTVYRTPTHPDRVPDGPEHPARIAAGAGVPVLGVGGVTPERARELRGLGAHGVAVIRGVWDAADPLDAVGRYLDAMESIEEGTE